MKLSKVRRRLEESLNDGRIATVVRDGVEITLTDGVVIALADDWLVLHALDDGVYLDDIVMLRLQDVSRVWFRDDDAYHHRAMAGLGQSITAFTCEPSAGPVQLLTAASEMSDIFAIHLEFLDLEPLYIGRVVKLRKKSFDFHYVGRDGVWRDHVDRLKYRDLTRVEVGGRYLKALNRFSDPYPTASA